MELKGRNKTDEYHFKAMAVINIFYFAVLVILNFTYFKFCNNLVSTTVIFISAIVANECTLLYEVKHLANISPTAESKYLFKKYSFIYEMLIGVALAFMIGFVPALFNYLNLEKDYLYFLVYAYLTWIGCSLTGSRCMINYAYALWERKQSQKIYKCKRNSHNKHKH